MAPLDILLVEDNPLNSELARLLLELEGHRVDVVADAATFRRALDGEIPEIVLMDILLADGDGVALLHELRASGRFPGRTVIALTAQALAAEVERLMSAGFDAVMTKPIDTRTFASEVARIAAARRPEAT